MKKYNHLLFDLDGTLTDPSEGITKCIAYALQHFGIETSDLTALQSWIGPPIKQSLMDIHHFDEAKADLGVEKYRERFAEIGLYENRLFDGIPELLESLKKQDYRLYLATSKPTIFAERILDHFEISSYFDFVGGSCLDDSRPTKAHVIRHVLDETGITDTDKALMIGDRKYDILGGKTFAIDTVGVLYGFGSRPELEQAGATYIVDSIAELEDLLVV
ncbi:HAD family hydrolase [Parapedobacter sp. SGR-10]|uniref:HAD family hydrolase n=1 Tax=Parapedobacter sp. SGR-10 TaxID=2710879 RepID=UPI0013D4AAC1|nr:HAD family hydrolase [Parapedobacter sp. SGR-10]NGF56110.1 HAD family hydrolase [Parapedobacter sp. SGR-10]